MTRRRWIADECHDNTAALTGAHAAHLVRVLRAQIGQEFDIAVGNAVRRGKIASISDDRVEFLLGEKVSGETAPPVNLVLAVFKFDRMEWAIEKCTEICVACVIPVVAQRTDAHLAKAAIKRYERWQRIAHQAAEQSRRGSAPEIVAPLQLKSLDDAGVIAPPASEGVSTSSRIVLAEAEHDLRLRDVLPQNATEVTLAIGPEGGWTEDELQWFRQGGWRFASLGDTILRAETAAIVATALAFDALR